MCLLPSLVAAAIYRLIVAVNCYCCWRCFPTHGVNGGDIIDCCCNFKGEGIGLPTVLPTTDDFCEKFFYGTNTFGDLVTSWYVPFASHMAYTLLFVGSLLNSI